MLPNEKECSRNDSSVLRQCEQMHQVAMADAGLTTLGPHYLRSALASTARTDLV